MKAQNVDEYFENVPVGFNRVMSELRELAKKMPLIERLKWGAPAYCTSHIVFGLVVFKNHVAIWFHRGSEMSDPANVLISAQESTKNLRQWRFTKDAKIDRLLVANYMREAIEVDKRPKPSQTPPKIRAFEMPDILSEYLNRNKEEKAHFNAMAPSHQREFANYVGEAKREETQRSRADKVIAQIRKKMNHPKK